MSSTFRLLCASHDPVIVIAEELTRSDVEDIFGRDGIPADHADCDIIAGRYSYPMVEAACLGIRLPGVTGCEGHHNSVNWTDSDWLRLLHAGRQASVSRDLTERFWCWPADRLRRLRTELGLDDGATMSTTTIQSTQRSTP